MIKWSLVLAIAGLPLICAPVAAQDQPTASPAPSRTDVFIGVGGQRALGDEKSDWRNSSRIAIEMNLSDRIALVFAPSFGVGVSSNQSWVDYAFLAGPRVRFRAQKQMVPFAQILAGVGRGPVTSNGTLRSPPDRGTAFLISFASGLDVVLTPRFAWRALQFEGRNQFGDLRGNQYVAVSTGVVIRFGTRK